MSLLVDRLSKSYGSLRALQDVSISFEPGEIHAVLGENGAGKSTLVSVLGGFVSPDSGRILMDGREIRTGVPRESDRQGIRLIHQHFTLVPEFTGEENLALGNLGGLAGRLNLEVLISGAKRLQEELGWDLRLRDKVSSYTVGQQQRLEILRALSRGGDVLLFDEPTAVLGAEEVDDLLGVLRRLRDQGKIVVLIAHKISEVLAVADRVTVLRKGRRIASSPRAGLEPGTLVEWMVGTVPPLEHPVETSEGRVVLSADALCVRGEQGNLAVRDVSFELRQGEILGIGGVDGNGQIELAEALAGVRSVESGSLRREGRTAYIPQDRQRDGLATGMSIRDNLLIGHEAGPFLMPRRIDAWARGVMDRFEIDADSPKSLVAGLSGGNQQKVVVGRALDQAPEVLVAVNPTRGLDVRATTYVHQQIRNAAAAGSAVVLISSDMDELSVLATRRATMDRGSLRAGEARADLLGGL